MSAELFPWTQTGPYVQCIELQLSPKVSVLKGNGGGRNTDVTSKPVNPCYYLTLMTFRENSKEWEGHWLPEHCSINNRS